LWNTSRHFLPAYDGQFVALTQPTMERGKLHTLSKWEVMDHSKTNSGWQLLLSRRPPILNTTS
jgi:hypothetical protein